MWALGDGIFRIQMIKILEILESLWQWQFQKSM